MPGQVYRSPGHQPCTSALDISPEHQPSTSTFDINPGHQLYTSALNISPGHQPWASALDINLDINFEAIVLLDVHTDVDIQHQYPCWLNVNVNIDVSMDAAIDVNRFP